MLQVQFFGTAAVFVKGKFCLIFFPSFAKVFVKRKLCFIFFATFANQRYF